jgi:hypothetical protein
MAQSQPVYRVAFHARAQRRASFRVWGKESFNKKIHGVFDKVFLGGE